MTDPHTLAAFLADVLADDDVLAADPLDGPDEPRVDSNPDPDDGDDEVDDDGAVLDDGPTRRSIERLCATRLELRATVIIIAASDATDAAQAVEPAAVPATLRAVDRLALWLRVYGHALRARA